MTDLSIISRYSRTFFERRLSEMNVGFTEQIILMYLCNVDSVNQEAIAKNFMLDKGAVAKTLNKLEEKNLITRSDNPNNKREKLISITEDGRNMTGYMTQELQIWHDYLFEGISQDEIKEFIRIFQKMSSNAVHVINGSSVDFVNSTSKDTKKESANKHNNNKFDGLGGKSPIDHEEKSSLEQESKKPDIKSPIKAR